MNRSAVLFAALGVLTAGAAAAQDAPAGAGGGDMRAKLFAMDTDHDGRWSKAEWLAGGRKERGFDFMDLDNDGFLTPDELRAGMSKLKDMRGAR